VVVSKAHKFRQKKRMKTMIAMISQLLTHRVNHSLTQLGMQSLRSTAIWPKGTFRKKLMTMTKVTAMMRVMLFEYHMIKLNLKSV